MLNKNTLSPKRGKPFGEEYSLPGEGEKFSLLYEREEGGAFFFEIITIFINLSFSDFGFIYNNGHEKSATVFFLYPTTLPHYRNVFSGKFRLNHTIG